MQWCLPGSEEEPSLIPPIGCGEGRSSSGLGVLACDVVMTVATDVVAVGTGDVDDESPQAASNTTMRAIEIYRMVRSYWDRVNRVAVAQLITMTLKPRTWLRLGSRVKCK